MFRTVCATLMVLGCAGLIPAPDRPLPSSSFAIPDGPWVFEMLQQDHRCVWQLRGRSGAPVGLGNHPGLCPSLHTMGADERGVPAVGITEEAAVVVRHDRTLHVLPAPPAGEPEAAWYVDGQVLVDTALITPGERLVFRGRTHPGTASGLPAFAIRWLWDGTGWVEKQVVEASLDEGDVAVTQQLTPMHPGLPYAGHPLLDHIEEHPLESVGTLPASDMQDGWLIADDGEARLIAGYLFGDSIHPCAPIGLERDGRIRRLVPDLAPGTEVEIRLDPTYVAISWQGGGELVERRTGTSLIRATGTMAWLESR